MRLDARGMLDGVALPGRNGTDGAAGVILCILPAGRQTVVLAHRGQADALVETAKLRGLDLPPPGRATIGRDLTLVATGPGQWMAFGAEASADLAGQLFGPLSAACTLVRVDDGRAVIHVAGVKARDTLAKMLTIDLHPRAFSPGFAAVTVAGAIAVTLWQIDDTPLFVLAVPRSSVRSLWHWLLDSAAEHGCLVQETAREVARRAAGS